MRTFGEVFVVSPDEMGKVKDLQHIAIDPLDQVFTWPPNGATDVPPAENTAGETPNPNEQLGLPRVADELYRSARRLRVFVAAPPTRPLNGLLDLLTLPAPEVERRLAGEVSLV